MTKAAATAPTVRITRVVTVDSNGLTQRWTLAELAAAHPELVYVPPIQLRA